MFATVKLVINDGVKLSFVGLSSADFRNLIVTTITEGVARQVMCLDGLGEVLVLEIDGGLAGIVDGEINVEGVVGAKNHRLFVTHIDDLELRHQAVGGLETLYQTDTVNIHGFTYPCCVELPEVVLGFPVVISAQGGTFVACKVMIQSWFLERASERNRMVARLGNDGFVARSVLAKAKRSRN